MTSVRQDLSSRTPAWHWGALAMLGAVLALWTWRSWADTVIDFGREIYFAQQISTGAHLYRDLAHLNGPLSPYLNGGWMWLTSTSITSLYVLNAAFFVGTVALLHRYVRVITTPGTATITVALFLIFLGFGAVHVNGSYSYLAPYSHDVTHGFLLLLLGMTAVGAYERSHSLATLAFASFTVGLASLTKFEMALASLLTIGCGLLIVELSARRPVAQKIARLGVASLAAGVPVILAFALLSIPLSPGVAWDGTFAAWTSGLNSDVRALDFYKLGFGTLDPAESLLKLLRVTVAYAAVLGTGVMLSFACRSSLRWGLVAKLVMGAAGSVAVLALLALDSRAVSDLARPLTLTTLLIAVPTGRSALRHLREGGGKDVVLRFMLVVASAALLLKMFLYARFAHYGFVLAVPATVLALVAAIEWVPAWIVERSGVPGPFRWGVAGILAGIVTITLASIQPILSYKSELVGQGASALRADPLKASVLNQTSAFLSRTAAPEATVAVAPEGALLNVILQRPNPTPYVVMLPPELIIFGEQRIAEAYRQTPPDYVVILHRRTPEYGLPYFGRDFGVQLLRALTEGYVEVASFGDPPMHADSRFGATIYQRRPPSDPSAGPAELP